MQRQLPAVGEVLRRALTPEIRSINEKTRTIEFVASDESVDRYGDIIRVAGWKYANYLKNPVFLWGHRSGDPPIGKCIDIKVEANPPALVQTIEFADAKTYPFADVIFNLYRGGFMRAVSVGFMPLEAPTPRKDEEGNSTGGYEFNGQELLELSAVPIPANQNALARAVEKGFSEPDLQKVFVATSSESVYREVCKAALDLAELSVDVATKVVQEALAAIKAQPNSVETELTLDQLLNTVKGAAVSIPQIVSLDELGEALKPGRITSIEQLGEVLQPAKTDNAEDAFFGAADLLRSRKVC